MNIAVDVIQAAADFANAMEPLPAKASITTPLESFALGDQRPSSSSRSASCFSCHRPARSAALPHVGFWLRRLGRGAFLFIVAIDR